eukprot:scaffold223969_cov30-Tisochrysis_lutea.AAC.8
MRNLRLSQAGSCTFHSFIQYLDSLDSRTCVSHRSRGLVAWTAAAAAFDGTSHSTHIAAAAHVAARMPDGEVPPVPLAPNTSSGGPAEKSPTMRTVSESTSGCEKPSGR